MDELCQELLALCWELWDKIDDNGNGDDSNCFECARVCANVNLRKLNSQKLNSPKTKFTKTEFTKIYYPYLSVYVCGVFRVEVKVKVS